MANRQNQNNANNANANNQQNPPDARANEGIFITNVLDTTQKPKFWLWLIVILLGLLYAGYKGWLTIFPWSGILTGLFFLLFVAFIIYGISTSGRQINGIHNDARFWVALVLFIWLLDMWPSSLVPNVSWLNWLRDTYTGFVWTKNFNFSTTFAAILASSFTLIFLYLNMVWDIIGKRYWGFILGFFFIIFVNNILAPNFFKESFLSGVLRIPYGILMFLAVFAFFIFAAFTLRRRVAPELGNFMSDIFMIFIFSFFWINNGWMYNFKALLHAAFIVLFGFLFIGKKESKEFTHIFVPVLLVFDFYGYGLLWSTDYLILKFIPLLVLFVVGYCYHKTEDRYSLVTFIFIVTIMLILSLQAYGYEPTGNVEFTANKGGFEFTQFMSTIGGNIKNTIAEKIDYASGGYFISDVEKNQYEPLGVYFSDVRAAQPIFYSDEDVTLWATIKSRTLNDPVAVNFSCSRLQDGIRKSAIEKDDKLYPENPFIVYTLEETDVECTFTQNAQKSKLQVGSNTITLSASYNFETSAYQKLYFIDRERLRAMTRENIDPYREFGINDREPITIHTNGPVELALKMQYLTPVSDDSVIQPNLGILIKNRNTISDKSGQPVGKWEGRVKKINDLVLILPFGMELDKESCTPAKFSPLNPEIYCTSSCISLCKNTCAEYTDSRKTSCENDCNSQLDENSRQCNSKCRDIFKNDDPLKPYNSYSMDIASLNQLRNEQNSLEFRDFDRHKTFGCRVKITSGILENVPITTKFIRAVARYDYSIDESYSLNIEKAPDVLITQTAKQSVDSALKQLEQEEVLEIEGTTPSTTILGLVYYESKFRHCCAEAGRNSASSCKTTDEAICPENRVLTSYDASSVGIMQINRVNWGRAQTACADLPVERRTVFDRQCNIKVGFDILGSDYGRYKNGASASILARYCPEGEPYHEKYKSYRGLDAVLRAYNGWSCKQAVIRPACERACKSSQNPSTCTENCFLGTINYVEKVKDYGAKVQSGQLQIPDVPEFEEVVRTQDFEDD